MKQFWKSLSLKAKLFLILLGCTGILVAVHLYERLQPRVTIHTLDNETESTCDLNNPISIGAFNIAHGRGDGDADKNATGETEDERLGRLEKSNSLISHNPPTFLVLNECDFDTHWSHGVFQPEHIAKDLYKYAITQSNYQARLLTHSWNFGNVILCNQKPEKVELIEFDPLKSY